MKDLIDREMAIKEIENEFAEVLTSHGYDSYEKADLFYQWYCDGLMKAIGILLDVDAEQAQWIPCSERMPDENNWLGGSRRKFSDEVLVSVVNYDDDEILTHISQTIEGKWALNFASRCKVIAWMPLPKPYEEMGEEE